jgi:ABC-2 type transport system ATP-binding protein
VQSICKRVGIVDRGKMLACGNLDELLGKLNAELCLYVSKPAEGFAEKLKGLAELRPSNNGTATIVVKSNGQASSKLNVTLGKVLDLLENSKIELKKIETHDPNLERLFLELTGSRLRD